MNRIEERLLRIERRLQVIVEGAAERIFPGGRISDLLARRLIGAVRGGLRVLPDGSLVAPERLALLVCPAELDLFQNPLWLAEIESALRQIGGEQGIRFPQGGFLQVESRAQLAPGELLALPCDEVGAISQTHDVLMETGSRRPANGGGDVLPGAFLIVDGTRLFHLDQPVINLGRRPDNHLVLEDTRVSRTHAQLRAVRGQFVIFDLESSGGTYVNGERITQRVLQPGDVVSLAGVPLIFGQDNPGLGETQEMAPEPQPKPEQ